MAQGPCCSMLRLKMLMFFSICISIFFLLLFWSFRSDSNFQAYFLPFKTFTTRAGQHNDTKSPGKNEEGKFTIVPVEGTKTLLISAFLEHRLKKKKVRVIAVALRSEAVSYVCRLCCGQELHFSNGSAKLHSDHFGFSYGTADIMCPLPNGCQTPTHVAVMPSTSTSTGEKGGDFIEVENQKERLNSFPNKFVVCISTMFDYTNVLQFVQTLEVMKLLGVNKVVIYKTSCSPDMQRLLDYYTQTGLVEVIPWTLSRFLNVSYGWLPSHGPGDIHYLGQIPALNDCMYRYMYRSQWMAMQDLDELILPQTVDSWLELMVLLQRKYGAKRCYMFQNNVFPINVALPPPDSPPFLLQPQWENVTGVNILSHLHQEPIIKETRYSNFKIIINPRAIISPAVHGTLEPSGICSWIESNIARLYHTSQRKIVIALASGRPGVRTARNMAQGDPKQPKLTADQLIYNGRLLNYGARLVPAVKATLRQSGL